MSETEQEETQRPLTIAMVVDTSGNRGNGTSNSALQWAEELERQGHTVRLVGVGAPEYPARVNHVPLVSWVAKKQQMQFAEPSDTLFRTAFQGVDVVHIYTPFVSANMLAKSPNRWESRLLRAIMCSRRTSRIRRAR